MPTKTPTPDEVLAALKREATPRTQRSLDLLHSLCQEQHQNGSRDFSVATMGRLSAERGGPSAQPIRNKTGAHYRALLAAWAAHADGLTRKPPARAEPGVAEDVLEMIPDAAVRAVVGVILAENRRLLGEVALLKRQAQVVVDRRPVAKEPGPTSAVQVLPVLSTLLPVEIEALQQAVSKERLQQLGWEVDERNGRVTKQGHPVFPVGFMTALRKVLEGCGKS